MSAEVVAAVLAVIAAALVVWLWRAKSKPSVFRVERGILIEAPAERIYDELEDFTRWRAWSPYEKLDPQMHRSFSGASRGRGAIYEWNSKGRAGAGRMEILEGQAGAALKIRLDFLRPFPARNVTEFLLSPHGPGTTRVLWAMHGPQPFLVRLISTCVNIDAMVGEDFEAGLASLKQLAEA